MSKLQYMVEPNVCLLLFASLVTLVLLVGSATDRTRNRQFMKFFISLLIAAFLMLIGEAGLWYFLGSAEHLGLLKLCAFMSFGLGAALNDLYVYCLVAFVRERAQVSRKYADAIAFICGAFIVLVFISVFNGMFFYFDEKGMYHDGPMYFLVDAVDVLTLLSEMLMVIFYGRYLKTKGILTLISFSLFPIIAMFALPYWNPTPLYLATTLSLILIYILFHGELTRQLAENEFKLAEKERELAESERELAESRISIMLSQLQPHFLFNVLNSIYYLCGSNPAAAQQTIDKFSDYLRNNMDSLEQRRLIPFEKEYEHIKTYLDLEKIRFGDTLKIVYDVETTNFKVPPLTVQPLVENAVKHGVTKKRGGGTVTMSTRETKSAYVVTVTDTGKGFDTGSYDSDGRLHVGIKNVRERLKAMTGGSLSITSKKDIGTTAVVAIPKQREEDRS